MTALKSVECRFYIKRNTGGTVEHYRFIPSFWGGAFSFLKKQAMASGDGLGHGGL